MTNITNTINNFKCYIPLIRELVSRDIKKKYRRSILGYLWSLLNPLMMMGVMTFVFTSVFKSSIDNYPLYLITGNTLYHFFTGSTNHAMTSISNNSSLIKKVYVPKYIFPIANVCSNFVITGFSLVAVFMVKVALRVPFFWTDLLIVIPMFFEMIFCIGMGMILAAVSVYFHDVEHLYGVLTLVWMYLTPIFYTLDRMPDYVVRIIKLNPLYHYITFFRLLIMNNYVPDINTWIGCIVSSTVMLAIGLFIFRKIQRNFILYI